MIFSASLAYQIYVHVLAKAVLSTALKDYYD